MKRLIVFAVLSTLFSAPTYGQETITVDLNGGGDFPDIQTAIDEAEDGDTVLVGPGEYVISRPINYNARLADDDPVPADAKNIVVSSEMGPEQTIVRLAPSPEDFFRGSVVLFDNNETGESVLDGFTLTKGVGSILFGQRKGGGVVCRNESSPRIRNCIISENTATYGGGIYCSDRASPIFTNCRISENTATCGGGLRGSANSTPLLSSCVVAGNSAVSGGGVDCGDAARTNLNCLIAGNFAIEGGSGCRGGSGGGGVRCAAFGNPVFTNCTIAENAGLGIVSYRAAFATLRNCVVWGNLAGSIGGDNSLRNRVDYCCVEGEDLPDGEGNNNEDPLFVQSGAWDDGGTPDDPEDDLWTEGDYHLRSDSPCVDAGDSDVTLETDLDGSERLCEAEVDIGAYELCVPAEALFRRGDANSDGNRNVADAVFTLLHLFGGGEMPICSKAADADDTGSLEVTDATYLLNYLFSRGPAPAAPFAECGRDPTPDELTCERFAPCM